MTDYSDAGLDLGIDLVNSYETAADSELLASPADLEAFAAARGFHGGGLSGRDLERARRARTILRSAMLADDAAQAVASLNALLASSQPKTRLAEAEDGSWSFRYSDPDAGVVDQMLATAAGHLLEEIRDHGLRRFSTCQSSTCDDVFLDRSRNHSRRFCTTEVCGNREAQRAFRARRATDAGDRPA